MPAFSSLDQAAELEPGHWLGPAFLDSAFAQLAAAEFWRSRPVAHICFDEVLLPEKAEAVGQALQDASFVRHPYERYNFTVAAPESLRPSALTGFTAWLASAEAARYHGGLAGWPRALVSAEVQVARLGPGDAIPVHEDDDGLAAVYGFSRDWQPGYGGVLSCFHPTTRLELARVEPRFNSVFLFRTGDAPHGVSQVEPAAGPWHRTTVTVHYHG